MLFMVIERFRGQDAKAVYRRFRDQGRMLALRAPVRQRAADEQVELAGANALREQRRFGEALAAFDRAIALANTSAEAAHIRMHLDRLIRDSAPGASSISKK